MKSLRRKAASIAKGRWAAYATAGAASAFACANSAEATIHYSGPINRIFKGCDRTATFQLDRPGDFIRLQHDSLSCPGGGYSGSGLFNVGGLAGASIAGFYNGCRFDPISASKLERGQLISNRPFVPAQAGWAVLAAEGACPGEFAGRGVGFIGFKFNNGSGDQYGWARIETKPADGLNYFKLLDYAYGDVGDSIAAGQRSGHALTPEEGSLGALALGAAGLMAWRKSRSRAAR
jgi:hypothetical protein